MAFTSILSSRTGAPLTDSHPAPISKDEKGSPEKKRKLSNTSEAVNIFLETHSKENTPRSSLQGISVSPSPTKDLQNLSLSTSKKNISKRLLFEEATEIKSEENVQREEAQVELKLNVLNSYCERLKTSTFEKQVKLFLLGMDLAIQLNRPVYAYKLFKAATLRPGVLFSQLKPELQQTQVVRQAYFSCQVEKSLEKGDAAEVSKTLSNCDNDKSVLERVRQNLQAEDNKTALKILDFAEKKQDKFQARLKELHQAIVEENQPLIVTLVDKFSANGTLERIIPHLHRMPAEQMTQIKWEMFIQIYKKSLAKNFFTLLKVNLAKNDISVLIPLLLDALQKESMQELIQLFDKDPVLADYKTTFEEAYIIAQSRNLIMNLTFMDSILNVEKIKGILQQAKDAKHLTSVLKITLSELKGEEHLQELEILKFTLNQFTME